MSVGTRSFAKHQREDGIVTFRTEGGWWGEELRIREHNVSIFYFLIQLIKIWEKEIDAVIKLQPSTSFP